jgi:hypothetical protein
MLFEKKTHQVFQASLMSRLHPLISQMNGRHKVLKTPKKEGRVMDLFQQPVGVVRLLEEGRNSQIV